MKYLLKILKFPITCFSLKNVDFQETYIENRHLLSLKKSKLWEINIKLKKTKSIFYNN